MTDNAASPTTTAPGHNGGPPLDADFGFRRLAWRRAKRALAPRAGIETVRRHVRRAADLGLTYPQYAAIRVGTGRDVRALIFSAAGLGWRRGSIPPPAIARIGDLRDVDPLLLARLKDHAPGAPVRSGAIRFAAAGPPPAQVGEARAAMRVVLDPLKLPGDAVVLIGAGAERSWVGAARLAGFVDASDWNAPVGS